MYMPHNGGCADSHGRKVVVQKQLAAVAIELPSRSLVEMLSPVNFVLAQGYIIIIIIVLAQKIRPAPETMNFSKRGRGGGAGNFKRKREGESEPAGKGPKMT
jgi:hypothetical protein